MHKPALAVIVMSALASCAPIDEVVATYPPAPTAKGSETVMLAAALADADVAAGRGNDGGLAQSLTIIAALDAQPLDPAAKAQLAQWQIQSPNIAPPLRGRTLGPGFRKGTLNAGGDLRIEQTFLSGQKASIALSTPGGSKLRLQVSDGAAKPVCQDVAITPACEWVPIFTQRHVIHLTNLGEQETRFYLVIE